MSAIDEYKHTSWLENCPLCVQLKARADAAIAELEAENKSQVEKTIEARQEAHLAIIQKRQAESDLTRFLGPDGFAELQGFHKIEAALAERDKFEDAVRGVCFDHNSVDMSGKVRWARAIPVSSVMRHIFDAYGSEPLTPNGTVPSARAEEG